MTILDDFESGSLSSDWEGDRDNFAVNKASALNNTFGVESTPDEFKWELIFYAPTTAQQGDTIEYYINEQNTDTNPSVGWGHQNINHSGNLDGYFLRPREDNSTASTVLIKYENDSYNELATSTGSITAGTTYRCVVNWKTDGTLDCDVYDLSGNTVISVSTVDNTFTSGYVAVGSYSDNENTFYDNIALNPNYASSAPSAPSGLSATQV